MNIEVGDYVRTSAGKIDKVINNNYYMPRYIECEKGIVNKENIVKHSKNIIDLIDVGDYVNGEKVLNIRRVAEDIEPFKTEISKKEIAICIFKTGDEEYYKTRKEKDIKTILTKEQMEANQYVVK